MFQFPLNPTVGQTFTPTPGVSFKWNGVGWVPSTIAAIPDAPFDTLLYARQSGAWVATLPGCPPGMVADFAGTPPVGWVMCDGTLYSTTQFPNLFTAIGYIYGGSGTSFAVPDCRGRTRFGVDFGGTGRITTGISGISPNTVGAVGGDQRAQKHSHAGQTNLESGPHVHGPGQGQRFLTMNEGTGTQAIQFASGPHQIFWDAGSGAPTQTGIEAGTHFHQMYEDFAGIAQNMPPAIIVITMIKT